MMLEYRLRDSTLSLDELLDRIERDPPVRVFGTAVFMTGRSAGTPPMLLHHLEYNQVLREQVVLLTVVTHDVPSVPATVRLEVNEVRPGIYRVFMYYGFMQSPNLPMALRECERLGLGIDSEKTTYYLGWETLIPLRRISGMPLWQKTLFAFMSRNAARPTAFYATPPERVVEIGLHVEL